MHAAHDVATLVSASANSVRSRGCLISAEAGRFFLIDFSLSSQKTPASAHLHALDPHVRMSGITDIKYWSGPTYDTNILVLKPREDKL